MRGADAPVILPAVAAEEFTLASMVAARSSDRQATYVTGVLVMVEGVERINRQLEVEGFSEVEVLRETHIKVVNAGLAKEVTAGVSKGAG